MDSLIVATAVWAELGCFTCQQVTCQRCTRSLCISNSSVWRGRDRKGSTGRKCSYSMLRPEEMKQDKQEVCMPIPCTTPHVNCRTTSELLLYPHSHWALAGAGTGARAQISPSKYPLAFTLHLVPKGCITMTSLCACSCGKWGQKRRCVWDVTNARLLLNLLTLFLALDVPGFNPTWLILNFWVSRESFEEICQWLTSALH